MGLLIRSLDAAVCAIVPFVGSQKTWRLIATRRKRVRSFCPNPVALDNSSKVVVPSKGTCVAIW